MSHCCGTAQYCGSTSSSATNFKAKTTMLWETAEKVFAESAAHCALQVQLWSSFSQKHFEHCRGVTYKTCVFYKVMKVQTEKWQKGEAVSEGNVAAAAKRKVETMRGKESNRERLWGERERASEKVIPVSVNLVTYVFSPPDRCVWPLPLFSITAGSDPFRCYLSLSLPLYQSLCHLSLHTSGVRDQHHPSAYGERGREGENKRRDFDFWCSFVNRFRSKLRLKVTENLLKPQWLLHTPTHQEQQQHNVPLIFSSFIQHKHTDTERTPSPSYASIRWGLNYPSL